MTNRIVFPDVAPNSITPTAGYYDYELGIVSNTGSVSNDDIYPGGTSTNYGTIPFASHPLYFTHLTNIESKLVFEANDPTHGRELWVTDGTAAGTMLLKDINSGTGDGVQSFNGDPYNNLPVISQSMNGYVYFAANNGTNGFELWKTDGTTANTQMVKDINSGSGSSGPYDFAVLGSTLFFVANDGTHGAELWKSDGSSANTVIVADIRTGMQYGSPASSNSYLLTPAGNTLFFTADDGTHGQELWKTDGTTTVMVKNINTQPIQGQEERGSSPIALVAIGSTVYFSADDGVHGNELWKSDGSDTGTVMVKNINPTTSSGNTYENGSNIQDMVSLNGTLIFFADDGVHGSELWKSDGTNAGTVLVKDINPVETYGGTVGSGSSGNTHLTVAGNYAYFVADNGLNGAELWRTDGTAAGTQMVINTNIFGSSSPGELQAVGSDLYFTANDGSTTPGNLSQYSLYKTDGTTTTLVASHDYEYGNSYSNFGIIATRATADFNNDLYSDIALQNDSGAPALWLINGTTLVSGGNPVNPGTTWHLKTTGDFDGDGKSDLLWQNDSGQVGVWFVNGTTVTSMGNVANPGTTWHVMGSGDFDGDGKSDIILQNDSGLMAIWMMNGSTISGMGSPTNPGSTWHVKGTGDFNGDGKSDIVLQNDDGTVAIWLMNGSTLIGGGVVANPGPAWQVVATGDFDGDGKSDLALQTASGQSAIWLMNGNTMVGSGNPAGAQGATWHIKSAGDYNGDGKSDLVWQNDSGQIAVWMMNGTSYVSGGSPGSPGASWHIVSGG